MSAATFQLGSRSVPVPRLTCGSFRRAALATKAANDLTDENDPYHLRREELRADAIVALLGGAMTREEVFEAVEGEPMGFLSVAVVKLLEAAGKRPVAPGEAVGP